MTRRRIIANRPKVRRVYRRVRLPLVRLSKITIVKHKPNDEEVVANTPPIADEIMASSIEHSSSETATQQEIQQEAPNAIEPEQPQSIAMNYSPHTLTEIASFNPDCNPYMNFISGMSNILAALPNEAFRAPNSENESDKNEPEKTDKKQANDEEVNSGKTKIEKPAQPLSPESETQAATVSKPTPKRRVLETQASSFTQRKSSSKHPFAYLQLPKASLRSCPEKVLESFAQQSHIQQISPAIQESPSANEAANESVASSSETKTSIPQADETWTSSKEFTGLMASLSAAATSQNQSSQAFNDMMQQRVEHLFQHQRRWGSFPWESTPSRWNEFSHATHNPISNHQAASAEQPTDLTLKKKPRLPPLTRQSLFASRFLRNEQLSPTLHFLHGIEQSLRHFPVCEVPIRSRNNPAFMSKQTSKCDNELMPRDTVWICYTHHSVSVFEFIDEQVLVHQVTRSYRFSRDAWRKLWIQANQADPALGSPREDVQTCRYLLFGRPFNLESRKTIVRLANQSPLARVNCPSKTAEKPEFTH